MLVQIFEYELSALVDTGSDITCISEEFWNSIGESLRSKIPMMPLKSFHVKTAVGHKSGEINKIVLLPIKLGSYKQGIGFVMVPGLISSVILGFDWL